MNRFTFLNIISFLLIFLFTYAGVNKLADHGLFQSQLSVFPFIYSFAALLSWLIPVSELLIVLLLLFQRSRLYAFIASFALLAAFTIFLIILVASGISLPCSCGGVIAKLSWKQHIVFNLFFIALSMLGIFLQKRSGHNSAYSKIKSLSFST
jgi:hypothetical protein